MSSELGVDDGGGEGDRGVEDGGKKMGGKGGGFYTKIRCAAGLRLRLPARGSHEAAPGSGPRPVCSHRAAPLCSLQHLLPLSLARSLPVTRGSHAIVLRTPARTLCEYKPPPHSSRWRGRGRRLGRRQAHRCVCVLCLCMTSARERGGDALSRRRRSDGPWRLRKCFRQSTHRKRTPSSAPASVHTAMINGRLASGNALSVHDGGPLRRRGSHNVRDASCKTEDHAGEGRYTR